MKSLGRLREVLETAGAQFEGSENSDRHRDGR